MCDVLNKNRDVFLHDLHEQSLEVLDFGAGGEDFDGVDVGVFVDDAAGNAVVLGVHEAECARLVVDVCILDLQGREIMRKHTMHGIAMDVKPLAPGLYHVVVSDGKQVDVKRFKK